MKHHIRLNGKALLLALLAFGILGASLAGCSPNIFGKYNNPRDPNNTDTAANLQGLGVSEGSLSPPFSPSQSNYVVTVPAGTQQITFFPDADQTVAQVSINGNVGALDPGDNTIVITVNASFGNTKNYTIIVHRTYAIGNVGPGGGLIFHVATNPAMEFMVNGVSCRYLEVAPAGTEPPVPLKGWATPGTEIGANTTGHGGGYANTNLIFTTFPSLFTAARYCQEANFGGVSDWYLPNEQELLLASQVLHEPAGPSFPLGGFQTTDGYWTSTEVGTGNARKVNFSAASSSVGADEAKGMGCRTRAIRAFY